MTLKQFFRKIRKGRVWGVDWAGAVRCEDGRCPLGAVDNDLAEVPSYRGAARLLGLRVSDARKIAHAADRQFSRDRPWLLKNLGITEIS